MAYVTPNFKTKKAFKEALGNGESVRLWQPNSDLTGVGIPENGQVVIEGPHYPEPHTWYANVTLVDGLIVKVE